MQCPSCGTDNSARVKFCAECGSPIGIPCPYCAFRNSREATVCGSCGRSLDALGTPLAERRQLTVFFTDIVGSTALSEMLDPEDLRELYGRYQSLCAEAIQRYDGYVAQYLGDGVLAYFGFPAAHEDDAGRAVRSALHILANIEKIIVKSTRPSLRIGIHTGLVVVGDVGTAGRREQLALGEAPNVAARLQGEALPDTIVISDATRGLLAGQFALEDLGSRTLKGISRPMQIYRVLGESAASRFQAMKSAHGLTPFVGREKEVEAIRLAWSNAVGGKGSSVLLRGEAGMGKSRLLEAAKQIAARWLHEVFEAQCSPYRMNSPLYPIAQMVERRLGIEETTSPTDKLDLLEQFTAGRGVEVEEAMNALAELLSLPVEGSRSESAIPPSKRIQMAVEVMTNLLLHTVNHSPVLLLIEDLHWADPSTLDLLTQMVARLADLPVLMVCTTRPEFSPAWLAQPQSREIRVEALSPDDARSVMAHIAGPKRLPMALVREVVARTGGIPLFIEAVTRTVISSGVLIEMDDRYELAGPLPSGLIPATVQDSLMGRIDRLGADKPVAQLAATIGRESSFELIQNVLGVSANSLTPALRRMVELGLVTEEGSPPAATYIFSHALIQDAAYESLLRKTRQEFHDKIAEALVKHFPDIADTKPELIARHHEGAGRIPEATAGWMKAGQQAKQRLALRECEAYHRKAVALLQTLPEDDLTRLQSEMEAQLALGNALTETLGWASPDLETAFTRARELCTRLENHLGLYQALNGLSGVHLLRAEFPRALETGKPVWEMAEAMQNPVLQIPAGSLVSFPAYFMADYVEGCRYAEKALALYTLEHERAIMALFHLPCSFACAHIRAMGLWCLGYPEKAAQQWREAKRMIEDLDIPAAKTFELGYMLHSHHLRRDRASIEAISGPAHKRAADEGFLFWSSQANVFHGWARSMDGDTQTGIAEMKSALESYRLTGSKLNLSLFSLMMAEAQVQAGRLDDAFASIANGLKHIAESREHAQEPELHRVNGEIHLMLGDSAAAETSLRRAIQVAQTYKAKMFEARAASRLARLLESQGRRKEAFTLLQPLDEWFAEGRDTPDVRELGTILQSLDASHSPSSQPSAKTAVD